MTDPTARPRPAPYTPPAIAARTPLVVALTDTAPSDVGAIKGWF